MISCLMSNKSVDKFHEGDMHNVIRRAAAVGGFVLVFVASAAWAQETVRVRGTIEDVEGQTLVVKSRDGSDVKVALSDNAAVVGIANASLSDIRPGSFVGVTGMPQADGSQKAVEVHIFPEAMRGTGEGHRPWDLRPQSTMTNANVEQTVAGVDGRTLTVKYKGGEKKIIVPPDAPIVSYVPGDKSELQPGVKIFVAAAKEQADGTLEASRVNFGKGGLTPPM